jgi:hypothetical protein
MLIAVGELVVLFVVLNLTVGTGLTVLMFYLYVALARV